jgi:hypothetical protein
LDSDRECTFANDSPDAASDVIVRVTGQEAELCALRCVCGLRGRGVAACVLVVAVPVDIESDAL